MKKNPAFKDQPRLAKDQFSETWVGRCQKCGISRFASDSQERTAAMLADNAAWNVQESLGTLGDCCRNGSKVELLVCPECARVPGKLTKGSYDARLPDGDCTRCDRPYRGIP